MPNLVIVGTIGLDTIETPFGKKENILGGSGTYASTAASFYHKPGLVGIVGADFPQNHLQALSDKKINLDGIATQGKTFRWSGSYEYDMNEAKTLKTELNSLADFKPKLPTSYRQADFLFLANIDPDLQLSVLKQMENNAFVLVDTMNFWISAKKKQLLKVLSKVNIVLLNEGEARQLFDTPNLIQAGRSALELGPEYVIIKKGEHGALLFSYDSFFSAPGYPLESVKDPTGAGDSFAGGLIGYLAKTGKTDEANIRKGIINGSCVASFCTEDFGLDSLNRITSKDIKERYNVFKQIRRF